MTVIKLKNITKEYKLEHGPRASVTQLFNRRSRDRIVALEDINLEIEHGQTIGIIGRNGSGKTTLLKLLSGVTKPSDGFLETNGSVNSILELGAGFHSDLTGIENIYLNASLSGVKRRKLISRIDKIISFADIGDFIDLPLRIYSDGMRLRLGFAVASFLDSDIFIIDEVLSVGDAFFQEKCFDRILQFKKENKTIVFSSHDLNVVKKLCDKVIFLDKGRIFTQGFPDEVVERYLMFIDRDFKKENVKPTSPHWPTDEVNITNVLFKNRYGEIRRVFDSREQIIIRIEYSAKKKIYEPIFGIGIYFKDIYLMGPNTRDYNFKIDSIEGIGAIEYKIHIPFASGRYSISASIHNFEETRCYDYFDRLFEFEVKSSSKDVKYGLLDIRGEWSIV